MIQRLLTLVLILFVIHQIQAQPGKNGNYSVPAANTVVNRYSQITANIAVGSTTVSVSNIATDLGGLSTGDLIMIYQAQGATILTTNDNNYGSISNYNSSGLYEYAYVASVAGNIITIGCGTKHAYAASGRAQVVKIPQYNNLTIPAGTSLVATKWNGVTGGIVSVHIQGTLTNNGTISAESAGFRGGKRDNLSSATGANLVTTYRSSSPEDGGEKGEGIAGYQADYDAAGMGGRYSRGAPANGGGGGNGHNAAGGGGANGNNGQPWTGAGVMDPNPLYLAAWQLDPDFISNGNSLTNSSGGGRGGYSYGANNADAFSTPLSDPAWGGDYRDPVGGRGGRPLAASVENRIFFGGGGGAGDGNNNASNDGGDGGGIVYVIANTITGSGVISAYGQNGYNTTPNHNDAPGGGGGGGTIIIKAYSFTGQTLNANGGSGGNQLITNDESEGCAGGGGGGFIAVPTGGTGACGVTNSYTYVYGTNGTSSSLSVTEFPPNGGTLGASGQNDVPVSPYFIPYSTTCLIDTDNDGVGDIIDLDYDNDGIANVDEGYGGVDPSADHDGDKIPNYIDPDFTPYLDSNCDGVNDYFDFDLDSVPDFLDLDSDNDGITDCTEAGGNDVNKDGIVDGFIDADGNGLSDPLGAGLIPGDLDGDTRKSFKDRDSDGDGITDCIEAGGTDANKDGIIDGFADTDKDGYANSVDPTTDRLALSGSNATGVTPLAIPDTDGDSKKDFLDIDSDNDGIPDNVEAQTTAGYVAPVNADSDGDGIADVYDITPITLVNTDGTDAFDYLDSDSDNDGVPDAIEGNDADSDGIPSPALPVTGDADGDGLLDGYDLVAGANSTVTGMGGIGSSTPLQDTDGDGIRDWRDTDDDGDCILTSSNGPTGENANSNASWADDFSQGGTTNPDYLFASNTLTVNGSSICAAGSAGLTATSVVNGIFRWYTASSGGTLLQTTSAATTSTYNTPSLTVTTTYYVEFDNGTCISPRRAVIATVISGSSVPSTTPGSRCGPGTVTVSASAGSAGTFRWYTASSGGTLLQTTASATTTSYTTPPIASTTTYYVEFDNGTCTTGRAPVEATVSSSPSITVTNGNTCGNPTALLGASSASSGTFNWYDSPGGGLLLFTQSGVSASAFTTPTISATTTYYVEYISGTCTSVRTPVTASITGAIASPTVTNSTICTAGTATISASNGSPGTFRWYTASSGGTLLQTTAASTVSNYTTPSISTTTSYYVEYSNGTCTSPRVQVTANVVSTSVAGINASRCGTGTITLGATSTVSGIFTWYANSSGGSALYTSTAGTTSSYTTASISATTTYYVSFTSTSPACGPTSPRVPVVATISTAATITGTSGSSCSPGTVNLSASSGGVSGTFRWYANSTGGTPLSTTASATTSSFTTPFLNATTDYYVEFDNGTCITFPRTVIRASVVNDLTTTDNSRCGTGGVELYVSSLTAGVFNWYAAASGGSPLATSGSGITHTYTTPSISATTTYYVSITTSSPACTSARFPVVATIYPAATAPTAVNGSRCGTGTVTIAASSTTAGTVRWYTSSSGGTLLQTDNTTTLSTLITPSISSTTTYYAEFSNGGCTSGRTAVIATVNPGSAPAAPAASGVSRCGPGTVALTATSGSSGVFRWWTAATGGALLHTTIAANSSTYNTPSLSENTTYYVEFDNGTCLSSSRRAVTATINAIPAAPAAASIQRCGSGAVMLTATSTSPGTFRWYSAASGGTLLLTSAVTTTSNYTTPSIATTTAYYVEFDNGTCTSSSRTAVNAIVNAVPAAPSGGNGSRCGSGSVNLAATSTSVGTFRWYDAAVGGTLLSTNLSTSTSNYNTPSISTDTNYFVEFDNGSCVSSRTTVTASVLSLPAAPVAIPAARCNAGIVNLGASAAVSGTFRWYSASTGGILLETDAGTTASSYTTPSLGTTQIYYVEFDNGTCPSVRTPVTATINPDPVITSVTPGCTGLAGNGTLTINASITPGTLEYSIDGISFLSSNVFSTLANDTYTVYVKETATSCMVSQAGIVVQCNVPPVISNKTTTTNEDNPVSGDVTDAGDLDPEGTLLTVNTSPVVGPLNGVIVLDSDGTFTYTPAADYYGIETITFSVCDNGLPLPSACVDRTLTITINSVNDEPGFVKGSDQTVNEDAGAQTVNAWATSISKGPANESSQMLTFAVTNDNNALFAVQPSIDATTGNLTFTPAANAFGSATVTVILSDDGGTANGGDDTFATQTFTITVNGVNDEPGFVKGSDQTVNEDAGAQTVNAWATSISTGTANESSQMLTFAVTNDNNALFAVQPSIDATGNLAYTPAANAFGSATVTVILSDDGGTANGGDDTFATQTFTITVNGVNDEPGFVKGSDQTVNEDAGAQTVNAWATSISTGPANESSQVLTFAVTNDSNALFAVQPSIDATTGNLTYTPAANAFGSATVTVILSDDGGTANGGDDTFATQTFTITVNGVNDEPGFVKGSDQTVNEDAGAQTVNAWATSISTGPANESSQVLTFAVTNDNNALFAVQPSIDATGNLAYTPAANVFGSATVTVILSDDGGTANGGDDTFATQTFTITVNGVNDEPGFVKGSDQTVNEDAGAQTVNAWATSISTGPANESSQVLTFAVTNDNNALFAVQPSIDATTGNLTYTPAANAFGSATVTVILSDDGGTANGGDDTFATQTFTITVNGVNDEPGFVKGSDQTVNEDAGAQTVNAWATSISTGPANESSQVLTFAVTNDNNALFAVQPSIDATTGNLTYTPAANAFGSAIVTVILSDDGGTANGGDDTFATQTFTITVNGVNDEPGFVKGSDQTVNEDAGAQTVNAWATSISTGPANESSQVLTFAVTNDNNALFAVQPSIDATTGNLTYTPAANAFGSAIVTVILSDDGGTANGGDDTFATQTFTITVNGVNDEPGFVKGSDQTVNEDAGAQTVNAWATSISKGPANESSQVLTFAVTNDNNALFAVQPSIDATTGNLTYTPAANAFGSATVTVILSDDGGTANGGDDTFATQTFTITVNGVNDEPGFVKGSDQTVNEDAGAQTVNAWATSISRGPANESSQVLTFAVTNDNNALFAVQPSIDATTGNLTYTPAANAFGSATVTVILSDDGGTANGGDDTFATQTFTITVNGVNDEPGFVKGSDQTVNEDAGAQTVNAWATSISTGPANESSQVLTFAVTNDNNALFAVQPSIDATTGNLTYTPAANAFGSATVTVILSDDGGTANGGDDTFATQTFTITVNSVNDAPSFVAGADQTIDEDAGLQNVPTWATLISAGPPNEISQVVNFLVTNDNNALFEVQPFVDPASGTLTYKGAANAYGIAIVSVVLSDDGGTANGGVNTSAFQTFTITINSINDQPVAVADNPVTDEDTQLIVNITGNDTDPDGTIDPASVDLDTSLAGIQNTFVNAEGSWSVNAAGDLTFVPVLNFNGVASISYTVNDDAGATSEPATISITVNPVNDAPVAAADVFTTDEDIFIVLDVLANDSDVDGTLDESSIDLDPSAAGVQSVFNSSQGIWTVESNGNIKFIPAPNVNGNASISYTVADDGGMRSDPMTISIDILPVNDAPVLIPGSIIATQGLSVTGNILLGGSDPDGTALTVNTTPVQEPLHGIISVNQDGTFNYTADPTFVGTDQVVMEVCDSGLPLPASCVNVTLTVTVVQNQRPSVSIKRSTLNEDFSVNGNVLGAGDIDPEGLPLKVNSSPVGGPSHGSMIIRADGSYTYEPSENFNGKDTVRVQVCDTNPVPACTIVDIIFTVNPVNDVPVLQPDLAPANRNGFASGNILVGDIDPDSTQLVVNTSPVSGPLHGVVVIDAEGNYTYTPDLNFVGTDQVTFEVCDTGSPLPGLCATSTLTITVTDPHAGVIFVPEGFSPNDDGTNDRFQILYTGTEPIHLEIFNRWGNIVYKSDNYQNDWTGVSMYGVTIGDELPDGTYFYKVVIGQFLQTKSFTLQR